MSNDLNQCNFIGRLGADPEVRYTQGGKAVANFNLACGWKGKESSGTEWIKVTAWGRLAEIIGEYLKKGSQVFISGRMSTRKWQDQSGQDRYSTEIVASTMQMLDSRKSEPSRQVSGEPRPASNFTPPSSPPQGGFEDDVPFARIPSFPF